jgi:hypothetical protein
MIVEVERREAIVLERLKMSIYIFIYIIYIRSVNVAGRECRLWNNTVIIPQPLCPCILSSNLGMPHPRAGSAKENPHFPG